MLEEDHKLREHPGDWTTVANPLLNSAGHFWGILATRDYMRARFAHVDSLLQIGTRQGVETALDHLISEIVSLG